MESTLVAPGRRRLAGALLSALLATSGAVATAEPGYLTTARGEHVKTITGLCVHTSDWRPGMTNPDCDPAPPTVAAVVPPPSPEPQAVPAPEPVPVAAPPTIEKIALSTEVLFAFDSATLRDEGKLELDALVKRIADASVEGIAAVGYADRIGSDAYNQGLSRERAEAVKRYLAEKGADGALVRTEGRGESDPVTGDACRGLGRERASNSKLVQCLQPDRRVEIEVFGTRTAASAPSASSGETR